MFTSPLGALNLRHPGWELWYTSRMHSLWRIIIWKLHVLHEYLWLLLSIFITYIMNIYYLCYQYLLLMFWIFIYFMSWVFICLYHEYLLIVVGSYLPILQIFTNFMNITCIILYMLWIFTYSFQEYSQIFTNVMNIYNMRSWIFIITNIYWHIYSSCE